MVSEQFTCCICLPKDQSVKKLSTKARAPTEGPEHQEVISKGQSAYRRTRASRSYQQRPERLPKDQNVKKVINKNLSNKLERTTKTTDMMETTRG